MEFGNTVVVGSRVPSTTSGSEALPGVEEAQEEPEELAESVGFPFPGGPPGEPVPDDSCRIYSLPDYQGTS